MEKPTPTRTSYAHVRYDLPGDPFAAKMREARIARQFEAQANPDRAAQHHDMELTEAQRRRGSARGGSSGGGGWLDGPDEEAGSKMICEENPHPPPRPSPDWAHDVDAAAFNARWDNEHRRAQIREVTATRDRLLKSRESINALEASIPAIDARAASGDVKGAIGDFEAGQKWLTQERQSLQPGLDRTREIARGR